jgi:hypothetical protein
VGNRGGEGDQTFTGGSKGWGVSLFQWKGRDGANFSAKTTFFDAQNGTFGDFLIDFFLPAARY